MKPATPATPACRRHEPGGYSLIELMIVLVVLTLGVLALARLFPAASREQMRDRLRTAGSYYAQDKMESLRALVSTDPNLAEGRHPDDVSTESLGANGTWQRYWTVTQLPDPLAKLSRVDVVVRWTTSRGVDSVLATTYLDH